MLTSLTIEMLYNQLPCIVGADTSSLEMDIMQLKLKCIVIEKNDTRIIRSDTFIVICGDVFVSSIYDQLAVQHLIDKVLIHNDLKRSQGFSIKNQ